MDQPAASVAQRVIYLVAQREQCAKRMASGQLSCQRAKVYFSYGLGSRFDMENNEISVSPLSISDSGCFPSLGFPLHLIIVSQ